MMEMVTTGWENIDFKLDLAKFYFKRTESLISESTKEFSGKVLKITNLFDQVNKEVSNRYFDYGRYTSNVIKPENFDKFIQSFFSFWKTEVYVEQIVKACSEIESVILKA